MSFWSYIDNNVYYSIVHYRTGACKMCVIRPEKAVEGGTERTWEKEIQQWIVGLYISGS